MNNPLLPYQQLVNERSFSLRYVQDEHSHGKKYYKQIQMTDAIQTTNDSVIYLFKNAVFICHEPELMDLITTIVQEDTPIKYLA